MSILYFNEDVSLPKFAKRKISVWINGAIFSEGKTIGYISFIFCSDIYLLEINRRFLKHDYYTDVITFDYVENELISGDIFISVDRINENAIRYSSTFENELFRIMIHGVLHLLGYKDKTIKEIELMREKELFFLKALDDC